jgi:hypothetical protein
MAIAALVINRPVGNCAKSDAGTQSRMMPPAIRFKTGKDLREKEIMLCIFGRTVL